MLAGARNEQHLESLHRLLAMAVTLPTESIDYERATALFRYCRIQGETVHKLIDCLIAAVAIGAELAVLHCDRDFDVLTPHTGLKIVD